MHKLIDLPYDYKALEPYMDSETLKIHHAKHHKGYVDKLNATLESQTKLLDMPIEEILADIDMVPEELRQGVINFGGGVANHNLFWAVLGSEKTEPEGELKEAIEKRFESFDNFKTEFSKSALTRFGSGWAWLVVTPEGELDLYSTPNQDSPLLGGDIPILCIDVWEHAYYLKFKQDRAGFIETFWNIINWEKIEQLYKQATE